ncbi:MAG: WD40 repeat protein, partial [Myxococcota bacterium]
MMDLMNAYASQPPAERESWLTKQRTTQGTALLSQLDYLTLRLRHGGSRALLAAIPDEPRWSVLREVVALSATALDSSPTLLPGQLLGRLRDDDGYTELRRAAAASSGLLPLTANLARPVRPLLATLRGHHDFIGGLIVLPGEHTAISASEDHTIRIWDLDHHTPLDTIAAHSGPVNRLLL